MAASAEQNRCVLRRIAGRHGCGVRLATVFAVVLLVLVLLGAHLLSLPVSGPSTGSADQPASASALAGAAAVGGPRPPVPAAASQGPGGKRAPVLNASAVAAVKKLVFFVGHERSCHSFVGSLIDAHPHMVLATGYRPLNLYCSKPSDFPSKAAFLNKLVAVAGKTGTVRYNAGAKGYDLVVDARYQGVFRGRLEVVGSQRAAPVSRLYHSQPEGFRRLLRHIRAVVGIPVCIVRVLRNPYDVIATAAGYDGLKKSDFVALKASLMNDSSTVKRNKIDMSEQLQSGVESYFELLEASEGVIATGDMHHDLFCDQLIDDPKKVIESLCDFFKVDCYEDYVTNAISKVFKTHSATRKLFHWPESILEMIASKSSKYPFLKRYIEDGVE